MADSKGGVCPAAGQNFRLTKKTNGIKFNIKLVHNIPNINKQG